MKAKYILYALALFPFWITACAQSETGVTGRLLSGIKSFSASHITEKVYLHFDKPYYVAGDTLYFKAYIVADEPRKLSALSGLLHVNLVSPANEIIQTIKLQTIDGLAWGDFAIPEGLPAGKYRVRAYTQWMLNEGTDAFFDQEMVIGSMKQRVPESGFAVKKGIKNKAALQFLPEGGSLVSGIRSKIAFKAVGADGMGINVTGVISDNDQKVVKQFASTHLGMGAFYLLPEEGKTYKAMLSYADGTQNTVELPAAQPKGMVLALDNERADTLLAGIFADKAYLEENKGKTVSLVIFSGGTYRTLTSTLTEPRLILHLPKKELKTGVVRVTLFSPSGEPVNERLAFIQNQDLLNLTVNTDKTAYNARENIKIRLKAQNTEGNPATGHFSVSVIDESKVPVDENKETTILSYLLITSELKGYVEQPNYYFADTSAAARLNLDLVMLTHGYRHFTWKQLLSSNSQPVFAYQPEKGLEIAGIAKSLFGKPLDNAAITLIPMEKGGTMRLTNADKDGLFRFTGLDFTDSGKYVLSAVNARGKNNTKMTLLKEKAEPAVSVPEYQTVVSTIQDSAMVVYTKSSALQQSELKRYGKVKPILLKQVTIIQKKADDHYRSSNLSGPGHADQVFHIEDMLNNGSLSTMLQGTIRGVLLTGGIPYSLPINPWQANPMLIILDGEVMNTNGFDNEGKPRPSSIDEIPPGIVETVEVLRSAGAAGIYGVRGGDGVLVITTRHGSGTKAKDVASIGVLPVTLMGYYKARTFYSPVYDAKRPATQEQDLRTTVYWKPELVTDKDGNAAFDYYNSDSRGPFRLVVEGIGADGNIGRRVFRYQVK